VDPELLSAPSHSRWDGDCTSDAQLDEAVVRDEIAKEVRKSSMLGFAVCLERKSERDVLTFCAVVPGEQSPNEPGVGDIRACG